MVTTDGTLFTGDLNNATRDWINLTYTLAVGTTQSSHLELGRWYSFLGDGLDVALLHLMGNLTPLVLRGTCSGGTLDPGDITVINSESIDLLYTNNEFTTTTNAQYWLLVLAREGSFQESEPVDPPFSRVSIPYEFSLVSQAYCEGASKLRPPQDASRPLSSGQIAKGVPACGSASIPLGKGIWFYIQGDEDKSYRLSTAGSVGLDTQLSVFEGTCDDLQCVAGNDDTPFKRDGQSLVQFPGYAGILYSILVHGADDTVLGAFVLDVEEFAINDLPSGAIPINLTSLSVENPTSMFGSTVFATEDGFQNSSCVFGTNAPSVWYSLDGTGQYVRAFLLNLFSFMTNTLNSIFV